MRHFYYPSARVACSTDLEDTTTDHFTAIREEVTCPKCLRRLVEDRLICASCNGATNTPHTCDPGGIPCTCVSLKNLKEQLDSIVALCGNPTALPTTDVVKIVKHALEEKWDRGYDDAEASLLNSTASRFKPCAWPGCRVPSDPRWFVHTPTGLRPACDGHGCIGGVACRCSEQDWKQQC